jgi:hypothetical protein
MIYKTITKSVFPDQLKQAQVVALHKKNNALDKSNYRPVSIISTAAMYLFWSSACFQSSIIFSSVVLQP